MDRKLVNSLMRLTESHCSYAGFIKLLRSKASVNYQDAEAMQAALASIKQYIVDGTLADEVSAGSFLADLAKHKDNPSQFKQVLLDWAAALTEAS